MSENKLPVTVDDCNEKPNFWNDDVKMDSWFAPFRNRDLNPLNYDNKLNYWKNNVGFFCDETKTCIVTLNQMRNFFIRNGKTPMCLPTVFEAIFRDGVIIRESEYEQFLTNNTWAGWAVNTLYNSPMKWLSKKMITAVKTPTSEFDESEKYIHLSCLKRQADQLLKHVTQKVGNSLVTYETVQKMYSDELKVPILMNTVKLLTRWLVYEKKVNVIYEEKHLKLHLLKFSIDSQDAEPIDDSEITMFCLQSQEKLLSAQLEQYEREVTELISEVKNRLKQGQKNMARSVLRKKKEAEKRIQKLLKSLDNIQTLLYTVQETETDKEILKSYQAGAKTLKTKFTKGELNINQVDYTMSEVDEVLNMHLDLQQTLSQSVGVEPSEGDLEDELSELLLNDAPSLPPNQPSSFNKKKTSNLNLLPEVPQEFPEQPVKNLMTE